MLDHDISQHTLTYQGQTYDWPQWQQQIHASAPHSTLPEPLIQFLNEWFDQNPTLTLHTSGSTGTPTEICVKKQHMINSAMMTCQYLQLKRGDRILLCMSLSFIAAKMMVVRALVAGLDLWMIPPTMTPLATQDQPFNFVAMVPLQVYHSLQDAKQASRLRAVKKLLIGGGAIDAQLHAQLQTFPHAVYASYGMTETVSHIALSQINQNTAPLWYRPLAGVHLSLSEDQTLIIDAPHLTSQKLVTRDIAVIRDNGDFQLLGRLDNVINSGGIKLQAEVIESKLRSVLQGDFAIGAQSDPAFGQIVVLLTTQSVDKTKINAVLSPYERPKKIHLVPNIPLTTSHKIDRARIKQWLAQSTNQQATDKV